MLRCASDSWRRLWCGWRDLSWGFGWTGEVRSVEQGMRFFRDEAFLEEATARREAERGTFDPGYIVYSLGKLMMLKLRHDYQEQLDGKFSLRAFHDAVLAQGTAPLWAHRRLLLNETADASLE